MLFFLLKSHIKEASSYLECQEICQLSETDLRIFDEAWMHLCPVQVWYIHTMEYRSALKRSQVLIRAATQISPPLRPYAKRSKLDTKGKLL